MANKQHADCDRIDVGEEALDSCFQVLADARRRAVIRSLRNVDEQIALADLARDLGEHNDGRTRDLFNDDVKQVYTLLYHRHVPKLAEIDIVDFDESERMVTKGRNYQLLSQLLAPIRREDPH